ncbi:MAG: HD-GYP domain-containing protein [Armatimonadota bacterium]|nr:HD-GYP domain-containing protein [bacterium]MDW8321198.1 HD-GYP domain-containing protein [Armatimonadota bacterium]
MGDIPPKWSEFLMRYYHRGVILIAAGFVLSLMFSTPPAQWLPTGALAILLFAVVTEMLPVSLLHGGTQVTLGFPIVCTVIAMYGTVPAMAIDSLPTLMAGVLLNRSYPLRHRLRWGMFNAAQSAISAGAAGLVYYCISSSAADILTIQTLLALTLAAVVYLVINALLVSVAGALYNREPLPNIWQRSLRIVLPTYVLLMPLSLLLILLLRAYHVAGFVLVAVPFLAARECFRQRIQQIRNYRETIRALGLLVQHAHPYTSGHLQRASQMAISVATRLGVPARHIELLPEAAALHDLGKVGIDEAVLNKLTPLTDAEWQMIRTHPLKGAEVVSGIKHIEPVALWITLHHERPDGKGYPFGLKLGEIPIEAHIIAVVDAFDAMVGDDEKGEQRPYRKPKTVPEAIAELQKGAGTQFHPAVVDAFIEALEAGEFGTQHAKLAVSAVAQRQAVA